MTELFFVQRHLALVLLTLCLPVTASDTPWASLDQFQRSLTRTEFQARLDGMFCPGGIFNKFLRFDADSVTIFDDEQCTNRLYRLEFAAQSPQKPARSFKALEDLQALANPADQPLRGIRIALDPGHIGGEFAQMEERIFKAGFNPDPTAAVQEAAANLLVARHLAPQLEKAGATVLFTKNDFRPVATGTPEQFREIATQYVKDGIAKSPSVLAMDDVSREALLLDATHRRMELEFYRNAEIRARAELVNTKLKPDLTLCIHFNANGNDPAHPPPENRLLLMIHGGYTPGELITPQQKFEFLWKVLENASPTELAAAQSISRVMSQRLKLPPEPSKKIPGWLAVKDNPFIYARNVIANRLYHGPVVYLEPFYQNNTITYSRLMAGDFEGEREIVGVRCRSIFRDYASAVAKGVLDFYRPRTTGQH